MILTNKHNLPKTIVNAMAKDPYDMGDARMSVTGLLKPPRISLLYKKHHDKIEKDVTDGIWALFGQAIHAILERGGDEEHLPEERLFIEVKGWVISGQLDLQKLDDNKVRIVDYKSCSSYAVTHEKIEWHQQINTYAHLLRVAKGYTVESLAVCAFIRDWSRHQAAGNLEYPQAPTVMVDIPLWSPEKAASFVEERVNVHQRAIVSSDMGDEPPECTDEERWMRKPTYAVLKQGNKRASKVFNEPAEAYGYASFRGEGYIVEPRPAEPIRCTGDYCGVSAWCSQYAKWKKENGSD